MDNQMVGLYFILKRLARFWSILVKLMENLTHNISDLKLYKQSKTIVKDIESINKVLILATSLLTKYKQYIPVKDVLATMIANKMLLDIKLRKYKNIVKNKGVENE